VQLRIFARQKQGYSIIRVTADNGQAVTAKAQAEAWVLKEQDFALMGHSTQFEQCMPLIEVSVYSEKEVERLLGAIEKFMDYWSDESELVEQIRKSRMGDTHRRECKYLLIR